jgi:hypothetical protein
MDTTKNADQRAHDVFWMTAQERDEYGTLYAPAGYRGYDSVRDALLTGGCAPDELDLVRWGSDGGAA